MVRDGSRLLCLRFVVLLLFFGIVASGLFGDVACSLGRDLARSCLSHGAYLCLMLQVVNVFVTGASRYTNLFLVDSCSYAR